jgi:hypothetical protein
MNEFDRRIHASWIAKTEAARKEFGAYGDVVQAVLSEIYKEMPEPEADLLIYQSSNYGHLGIGTGLGLQRRIILRLIAASSAVIDDRSAANATEVAR